MSTRAMQVANIAFLLDRLAADTPPNQQIRELTENALEAIERRHKAGDAAEGIIRWDVDWDNLKRTNQYKLSITDNGDGMTSQQMLDYLNALAVQGANQTQGISQNFGVGAKITALHRNSHGLVYQSWHQGKGSMVKLHRDDKEGVYGLASFDLADGPDWTPRIKDSFKPKSIDQSGTKVTLLGTSENDNTCFPPADAGGGMNWLITYLTGRYFRVPENTKIQVRVLTKDEDAWPSEEPSPSAKTFNFQTVSGSKALFDQYSEAKGTVQLATADAHWWVFADPKEDSKKMSTRGGRTCKVGIVFQDEVYVHLTPPTARRLLAGFGIVFGADHVVIYVEPKKTLDIRADTARSRIIINGEDVQEANWFEIWGAEFREKMPAEIKAKIDEIMAKTERDPDGKTRERILERLQRIRDLLRPTRYRRDPNGSLRASGQTLGGGSEFGDTQRETTSPGGGGHRGGRSSDDYLADLVESGGEAVNAVVVSTKEPAVKWVSRADGTREEGELDDLAAEIVGDTLTGEIVKANRDFRGYRDLVGFFTKEFNPGGDPAINRKIVEYVEEWLEGQLVEAIMTVRNLTNGRTWTPADIDRALSAYSLTTVMMARFHIVERVKRSLSSDLARPSKAA
ncbi:ATP-binding protein [Bradyrhizobium japonicum]|uniref:ATP-binding protein n=1 Tax=Bradyrhizobium japonicum TaxID=375 RepID=UPI0003FF7EE6|nr:ATP-binding protein [Bradyrhizobium japonicum]